MGFPLRKNKKKKNENDDPKRAGAVAPGAASGAGGSSGAASGSFGFGGAGSAGASGAGGAAPGSGLISSLGTAAPSSGANAGLWTSIVDGIARTTGLSAVAASKAGIAGIVLAVSSGVAGVSMYMGNTTPTGERGFKRRVFALQKESQETTAARAVRASKETPGNASSLEYTPKLTENLPEAVAELDGPAPAVSEPTAEEIAAATEKIVDAPVAKKKKRRRAPPVDKPKLSKRSAPKIRTSNQTTKVALKPLDGFGGGVGSGFQDIYKANGPSQAFDGAAQKRPRFGANRKTVALNSGSRAMDQAKFAGRMSRGAARMGRTSGASHTAALPFDGVNAAPKSLGKAEGTGLGGTGLAGSANSALGTKVIDPPPPPEDIDKTEDKTPYQGMLYAAMGALALGTLLLMAAGKMISQGRNTPGPQSAGMISQGKALAMAAMGAGGAAAGMGAMIAGEHGQITQGMPFITGGGILAVQAGMVLAKADSAGEDAQSGIGNAAGQAAQQAGQMLGQNMQAQQDAKEAKAQEKRDAKKQQEEDLRNRQVVKDNSRPGYQGNIDVPGL
jgi:hypothetical protein